ncbi:MAG: hypothetical protein BWY67_01422 [Bacteroidetes bacterium ADurb.Bin397]|nr:MAG: hypothetical protein BWY67_01422 [Bacteroidetes bacterium ADurb.Bin397]
MVPSPKSHAHDIAPGTVQVNVVLSGKQPAWLVTVKEGTRFGPMLIYPGFTSVSLQPFAFVTIRVTS